MLRASILILFECLFITTLAKNNEQISDSDSASTEATPLTTVAEESYSVSKSPNITGSIADAIRLFEIQFDRTVMSHRLPSISYALSVNGNIITQRYSGESDIENRINLRPDSRFRLSSITKTFTALAIGQAVKQGHISYHDSVWKYLNSDSEFPLKQFRSEYVNITVHHLLTHTAGLGSFDDELDLWQIDSPENCTHAIKKLAGRSLRSVPGSVFEFSHYGYQILGAILEKVYQTPFDVILQNMIHDQLGLNDTVLESPEMIVDRKVRNYRQIMFEEPEHPGVVLGRNIPAGIRDDLLLTQKYSPAIGVLSTVPDMIKYGELLLDIYHSTSGENATIIGSDELKDMWRQQTAPTSGMEYGYGWAITKLKQQDYPDAKLLNCVWHDGQLLGSSAILQIYPEQRIVAVAFTNVGAINWLDLMMISLSESVYAAMHPDPANFPIL